MAEYLTQSRPYAEAIFEIAEQDNSVDSWIKDLALISTSFQDNLIQALIDFFPLKKFLVKKLSFFLKIFANPNSLCLDCFTFPPFIFESI